MYSPQTSRLTLVVGLCFVIISHDAQAGDWRRRVRQPAAPVVYQSTARTVSTEPRQLGTFYPSSTLYVRGNGFAGGGYSPLGQFGNASMTLYGPTSAFRDMTAPVQVYARGYNGAPVLVEGSSFSSPNEPDRSRAIYPTQATDYYGFRQSRIPPWWPNGINWIDQN